MLRLGFRQVLMGEAPAAAVVGNNDVTMTLFAVDGEPAVDEGTLNLANGTTSVIIDVTLNDVNASIDTPSGDIVDFSEWSPGQWTWEQLSLALGDNPVAFTIRAEDGVTTDGITLNLHVLTAGVSEITEYDFAGKSGADFVTGTAGKFFIVPDGAPSFPTKGYWFNTGTEAQPGAGADSWEEVTITAVDGDSQLADAFAAKLVSLSQDTTGSAGTIVRWTLAPGARGDAQDATTLISITKIQDGEDPS